jgi:Uncharacterized protein conserved in bacteria
MQLSEHFSFDELTTTSHSELAQGNKKQAESFIKQLKYTAGALEEVRSLLGVSMTITSGYRSPMLNKEVGGSPTSKHTHGLCADFKPNGMTVKDAFAIIQKNKDKLHSVRKAIIEGVKGKEWIHLQAKVNADEPLELYSTNDGINYKKEA